MKANPISGLATSLTLSALCLFAGSTQAARTITADSQTLFGQKVQSLTTLDDQNRVSEIEVVLPFAALLKANSEPASVNLALPGEVTQQISFHQVKLIWAPQGRGPADSAPLFNLYLSGESARDKVLECNTLTPRIVDHWTLPFPPGVLSGEPCSAQIGFHAALPDEPGDYRKVKVSNFTPGKANFCEPVFNKNLLEAKQSFELTVPLPQYLNRSVLHPRKLVATYEASIDSYTFALKDFVQLKPWSPR